VLWAGETASYGAGSDDAYLVQMSPEGKATASHTWGGAGIDHGEGVGVADGTILLGATTETTTQVFDRAPTKTSRVRGTVALLVPKARRVIA